MFTGELLGTMKAATSSNRRDLCIAYVPEKLSNIDLIMLGPRGDRLLQLFDVGLQMFLRGRIHSTR